MQAILCRLILLAFCLVLPISAAAATWQIDPDHSSIQFKIKHLGIAYVRGIFEKFEGMVQFDDQDIAKATVQASIDVASLNTAVPKRDEHLRSADFFDVASYPTMTFVAQKVIPSGKDTLQVIGALTLRGITREVVLNVSGPTPAVQDPWGNIRRGASATAVLDRRDFGLTWHKTLDNGVPLIGHEVIMQLEIEMIQAKE